MTTYILIMVVLIILSAYFSATETAFSSVNKTRLKIMSEKGNKRAALALRLSEKYDQLISTILIGNNIVNIATATVGTIVFVKLYGDIGATVSTIVVTVAVLIFGEICPKSIAKNQPEKFAVFSAPMLNVLIVVFTPLNFLFSLLQKGLAKLLKVEKNPAYSREELLMLVDEVEQDGSIDEDQGELLKNTIEFFDRDAEEVLTHRVDIVAAEVGTPKSEIAQLFERSGYSRIPIYENDLDHICGVIHQKDFYVGDSITPEALKKIAQPVVYVMQNEKISEILRRLQRHKSHMAVVVDEFGGTYGIVTMEDILEELVGEIWDEHDEVKLFFEEVKDGVYQAEGAVPLDEFCDFFNVKVQSEMVSLGGWVSEQLGHIADVGESFEYEGFLIKVTAIEHHRVETVEICRKE